MGEGDSRMKRCFVDKNFSEGSLAIIEQSNVIITEYLEDGYTLTLRQLYYQFVARDLIANRQSEYKRLGSIINDARLAGLIDWDAIEDRGRSLLDVVCWNSPQDIIENCARQFKIDLWDGQKSRVEVWIEKEALIGVIEPVCRKLRVPHFACKGYVSQSEMFDAGFRRIRKYARQNQEAVIIHLGDHDPSGIDMTRDIETRLELFAGDCIEMRRIALNADQIEKYNPPPNPAKVTDSRFESYSSRFGDESWELDALDPATLAGLVEATVKEYIDDDAWQVALAQEKSQRVSLELISRHFSKALKAVSR